MKISVAIVVIFGLLDLVMCRPSAPLPGGITRDTRVELPGSERINKRSAEDYSESSEATLLEVSVDEDDGEDNTDDEEVGDVDGYSADDSSEDNLPVNKREALNSEDFEVAESNIIFQPLFVARKRSVNKKRSSRSTDNIQEAHKISSRSVNKAEEASDNDMEVAENGMVFLPLFRSRSRFTENQRIRRSAENAKTKTSSDVIETDDGLVGSEDIFFKPVSRRGSRPVRSAPVEESLRSGDDLQGGDDMAFAENGLIFRPLLRTRQRDAGSI